MAPSTTAWLPCNKRILDMISTPPFYFSTKEVAIMSLKVHTNRCKGCGICVAFCPKQVLAISEIEKVEVVAEDKCIQCGQCETRCPDFAIFVEK